MEPPLLVVPSGNLGNLTAAAYAKTMGLPLGQLVAATNANTVVPDYLRSGEFMPRPSMPTLSSAMDVGNPSNLARLQALYDDDIDQIQTHIMGIGVTDEQTLVTIRYCYENYQVIIDPHTAVGVAAAKILMTSAAARLPAIITATAHPAKFTETIYQALTLNVDLPPSLAAVMDKPKQSIPLTNDFAAFKTILLNHAKR
jgi:threonine synthase